MKKTLGKKIQTRDTVEAYACGSQYCSCSCTCDCVIGDPTQSEWSNVHNAPWNSPLLQSYWT